ncbi:MAG: hypothetical protein IPO07_00290 [Haliscomenobacter sp.]|nr:hypothetical protein [Haliscomenobacter sp.]MBK9487373.1 hypothetical protein [Haliscomenobacter sp.]
MQKMYTFIILCLLFVKLGAQKASENDFIINLNGETIIGEIKLQALPQNYQMCYFKAPNQKEYQAFNPTQIKGFLPIKRTSKANFHQILSKRNAHFLSVTSRGSIAFLAKEINCTLNTTMDG